MGDATSITKVFPEYETYTGRQSDMKQQELKKCANCGKGVMHSHVPIFYRVTVERMCVNLPAVERQAGLEMMLGGHAAIAAVMGPDEDMAVPLGEKLIAIVCQDCSLSTNVAVLSELEN